MASKRTSKIGIDIFSGAGGLSLGAEWAGINVSYAIELDKYSSQTYRTNHPNSKIIEQDIRTVDPLNFQKEDVFILFGGPPCQGFSTSNRKTRNSSNNNNKLFEEFLRFIKELSPEWFLFENVEGITNYNNGETLAIIKQGFIELGYLIVDQILYASDYGVPQKRNRYFIVGNKKGIDFSFPRPVSRVVTVEEAISDLPQLFNGSKDETLPYRQGIISDYAKNMRGDSKFSMQNLVSMSYPYVIERFKHIKQGENWKSIPEELMTNYKDKQRCHSGIYKRLVANQPSIVISNYRKNMLIHPFEDRGLSVREAARLQSFPDSFIFEGSLMHKQQQIGNAVPPLLAKAIFEQILQLNDNTYK